MERRNFINLVGKMAVAAPIIGSGLVACGSESKKEVFNGHQFPDLPYAYDALEPNIDAQTMELHYDKHHRGYFTKFMKAIEGTELEQTPMPAIFAKIDQHGEGIRNNGGGFYNHQLFWENMSPNKTTMDNQLKAAIEADFGSVEAFKEQFEGAAKTQFGSGWAWLSLGANGKLFVSSTANQDNPLMNVVEKQGTPLLALDVWEHAYYLNYQNRRGDYVGNFWNIINWDEVARRYQNSL